mgnify:CR=1 FL=1
MAQSDVAGRRRDDMIGRRISELYPALAGSFERAAFSDIAWARTLPWRVAIAGLWPDVAEAAELHIVGAGLGRSRRLGGGFFWQTLDLMLPNARQATPLYRLYRKSLYDLKR